MENGQVNTTATSVPVGTVLGVTCNSGYTTDDNTELTCQADQTFNHPWPICGKLLCGIICSVYKFVTFCLLFCVL